jgi:formamidopyrimidine-DNA glycosylase
MIELPDVERMIDGFAGYATGKTISEVLVDDPEAVDVDEDLASEALEDHAIEAVERRGRYIVLRFESGYRLVFHMGDKGEIYLESQTAPPHEDSKIRLQFAAGRELRYSSPGTKGEVHLVEGEDFTGLDTLETLGIDPLSDELTGERLVDLAREHPQSSLKGLLMNQEIVAGIGNEYADEICFQAGYRPDTRIHDMTDRQIRRVHKYLKRVLRRATLHWEAAHADPGWLINHRSDGEPCPRCGNPIESMTLIGRKTYICPRCQREP